MDLSWTIYSKSSDPIALWYTGICGFSFTVLIMGSDLIAL